ncbi:MAG: hypothetical protein ACE149_15040 [Armatimonadota bacterium]
MGRLRLLVFLALAVLLAPRQSVAELSPDERDAFGALGNVIEGVDARGRVTGCANMILNGTFEEGRASPNEWSWFGLAPHAWEFGGKDGGRCVSIAGDGANAGWWYAKRWVPVAHNRVYRVSLWARGEKLADNQTAFVGLNRSEKRIAPGPEWGKHEYYFRSPNYLPDPRFRLGQQRLQGQLFFDDVSLVPVVAVHRSSGKGGGFTLGDGEKITNGRYLAIHDLSSWHSSDARFLDSYTAEFHGDRWVLDHLDEVIYKHEVRRLGVGFTEGTLTVSDAMKYGSGYISPGKTHYTPDWVRNDPRAACGLLQRPISVDVELGRHGGPVAISICQDGHSWQNVGFATRTGTTVVDLLPASRNAYELWVRLKAWGEGETEITGYRYESQIQSDNHTTESGTTHYLAVLYSDPTVLVDVADLGEMTAGGRSEVKLLVESPRTRLQLDCRVALRQDGKEVSSEGVTEWMAGGAHRRLHIPYAIPEGSAQTMAISGKDADSGRLLFLLESSVNPSP